MNLEIVGVADGWADPGYTGSFSRQPRWLPGASVRTIRPGDVIGFGQLIYYPKGVETPYGDQQLGSQYQGGKRFSAART